MIGNDFNKLSEARLYINGVFMGILESTKVERCEDGACKYDAKVEKFPVMDMRIENKVIIPRLYVDGEPVGYIKHLEVEHCGLEGEKYKIDLHKSKMKYMNKIHNLKCNEGATIQSRLEKLNEEFEEVVNAYVKFDKENLIEELLDVVQMCYGVAYTIDVDLDNHIKEHNEKLLEKGHKFVKVEK